MALDDGKGLPVGQPPTSSTLPPSNVQASQRKRAGLNSREGRDLSKHTPHPYPIISHSRNQYYGAPYSSGYVPQPFVKYRPATMFQPGPPGSASANSPAAKQPGGNVGVQPQTKLYNQALYQQGGYDDYQPHPHRSQHQHQHLLSLGLSQRGYWGRIWRIWEAIIWRCCPRWYARIHGTRRRTDRCWWCLQRIFHLALSRSLQHRPRIMVGEQEKRALS